ncbi:MAG: sugar phosphate isomerase/epimerase [Clostridiales bacterium]|jgi:sugar phosphate isomerase/epimerase|nr:sugar phosphate isomerase/epimerase [Clostridiales bacterium]
MKIGVRAHDFGKKNEKDLAKEIKCAGFDCVQLALTKAIEGIDSFDDITHKRIYNIKNEFDKNNIEISVLGCYIEPSIKDGAQRAKNINTFIKSFEHAKILGTNIIGTETTKYTAPETKRGEYYEILKDSVKRIIEEAEKSDIIMGIEPVVEHTLNNSLLTRELLDQVGSKKLKVIFDPVNLILPNTAMYQELLFKKFFELLGDDIAIMHAKDISIENKVKDWRNIGDGVINYDYIFKYLSDFKPDLRVLREGIKPGTATKDMVALKTYATKYTMN